MNWRTHGAEITLGLTLVVCAAGLLMGVPLMQVVGVLLFGLVLTAVNSIRRKGE